jgi:hypothetical protein
MRRKPLRSAVCHSPPIFEDIPWTSASPPGRARLSGGRPKELEPGGADTAAQVGLLQESSRRPRRPRTAGCSQKLLFAWLKLDSREATLFRPLLQLCFTASPDTFALVAIAASRRKVVHARISLGSSAVRVRVMISWYWTSGQQSSLRDLSPGSPEMKTRLGWKWLACVAR